MDTIQVRGYFTLRLKKGGGKLNSGMVPNSSGSTIVEAENLLKKFGNFVAVNRISFKVATGECFGI
jgi:hypothetical protein